MRQREAKYISAFTTWYAHQKWKKPWYLVWKVQGTLYKGCSWYWIGGPTGSGKTLVAAW